MSTQPSVCIVGGGAAGLTLASALAARSWRVTVVEGGRTDAATQFEGTSRVQVVGTPHRGVDTGRFRGWGGSTARWGGQLWPWEPYEFEPRARLGIAGWPISFQEIASHTEAAFELVGLPNAVLTPREAVSIGAEPPRLNPAEFILKYSTWLPWRKRNLGRTIGAAVRKAPNVTVHLEHTATRVVFDGTGRCITGVRVRGPNGDESTLDADTVVLAAGAIETSRLLFASAGFASGSSTRWSWLGRGFMDHLSVRMSRFRPRDVRQFGRMFAPIFARGAQHTPRMLLTPELLEREGLLGCYGHWEVHSAPDSAFSLLREKLRAFQAGHVHVSFDDLLRLTSGLGEVARLAHGVAIKHRRFFERDAQIYLRIDVEQRPDPESRIMPIGECDSFGLPRVALDWRVSSLEQRTAVYAAARLGEELRRLGIGELEPHPNPFESQIPWGELKGDSFHMMGGTRMAKRSEDGVVDTNCQVFGTENLFVASTSVFPTGGMANPTLLLLSLTLRLAEHMADRHQRRET